MKYRAVTYYMGDVINILNTDLVKEVKKEYSKGESGNLAVRVWVNGKKLPYIVSNSMFGSGSYERVQYGRRLHGGI